MTNGEKIKEIFPFMIVVFTTESQIGIYFVKNQHSATVFSLDFWNAEYKEPFINKPCVSSGVCEHVKHLLLDKIRAEIDKIYEREGNSFDCINALDELKEFIDKLNTESEE